MKKSLKTNLLATTQKILKAKYFNKVQPLLVEFCLTYHCNLNCFYCGQLFHLRKSFPKKTELSYGEIDKILNLLRKNGVNKINFSGGEPLIRNDIEQIIENAKSKGFFISLATNGVLVPQKGDLFKKIDLMIMSLDGLEQTQNFMRGDKSYQTTLQAIAFAHTKKIPFILSAVLTQKTNIEDIDHILNVCHKYNTFCVFQPVSDRGFSQGHWQVSPIISTYRPSLDQMNKLINYLKQHKYAHRIMGYKFWCNLMQKFYQTQNQQHQKEFFCMAGRLSLTIAPDGKVFPCSPRSDAIMNIKEHPDRFRKFLLGTFQPLRCSGCFCHSYVFMNNLTKFNFQTARIFWAHRHLFFSKRI